MGPVRITATYCIFIFLWVPHKTCLFDDNFEELLLLLLLFLQSKAQSAGCSEFLVESEVYVAPSPSLMLRQRHAQANTNLDQGFYI